MFLLLTSNIFHTFSPVFPLLSLNKLLLVRTSYGFHGWVGWALLPKAHSHLQYNLSLHQICNVLRDLLPFVQFKKHEKHPWRLLLSVKLQAKAINFTRSNTSIDVFHVFLVAQMIPNQPKLFTRTCPDQFPSKVAIHP